ncbi:MAG TPA: DUF1573 domain-containing protein [Thermoanaerobacterales bacterium]|nr:DUF1573 domain-containing protein [Thermoanaerobacterales bacterium]
MCDEFQDAVSYCLMRHRSIIDVITKLQESNARVNRALAKSITVCGCLEINAKKQDIPEDAELADLRKYIQSHLKGTPCGNCIDVIEKEIGSNIFYVTALCEVLGLNLNDILSKEYNKITTLGIYNLS